MAAPAPEELETGGARVRAREPREHDLEAAELRSRVRAGERVAHARKRPGVPSLGPGPLQSLGRGPRAKGVAVARELERVPPLAFCGADDARQLRVALEDAQLHVRGLPRRAGLSQQISGSIIMRFKGQRPPDVDVESGAAEGVEEGSIRFELRAAAVRYLYWRRRSCGAWRRAARLQTWVMCSRVYLLDGGETVGIYSEVGHEVLKIETFADVEDDAFDFFNSPLPGRSRGGA